MRQSIIAARIAYSGIVTTERSRFHLCQTGFCDAALPPPAPDPAAPMVDGGIGLIHCHDDPGSYTNTVGLTVVVAGRDPGDYAPGYGELDEGVFISTDESLWVCEGTGIPPVRLFGPGRYRLRYHGREREMIANPPCWQMDDGPADLADDDGITHDYLLQIWPA
jgi:hypothetical protein